MALSAGSVEIRLFAELARLQSDMKKANKVVEDAMGGIQKTVKATTSVFNTMAGAFSAGQIIKLADDYKRFDAQLKLSTKSLREYGEAYNNVIRIGRTAQSDIGAIGVLYARLNNNLRDFNVTQNQVASVTETISLALRTNNATVQETNSVMLQLSQSFGSGKLNGQEFLAVAEGAPMLLRQLATSLGKPYGALKDLSAQGKITREDLLKAWSDPAYLAALRQQVKEVGTVTSSITVLMNNLKQYIGEADKATNATRALSWIITLTADNIDKFMNVAIAAGVAWLVKWSQVKYSAMVASKAHAAQEVVSSAIVQQAAIREAAIAESKLALDKLVLIGKVNLRSAKVAEAEASVLAAAGTLKEANAIKVLEVETLKLMKAKGALAAANGAVGVSAANNALAVTKMAHGIQTAAVATGAMTVALNGAKALLAAFGGWIGLAITAVILFGDKIFEFANKSLGELDRVKEIARQLNEELNKTPTLIAAKAVTSLEELANVREKLQRDLEVAKAAPIGGYFDFKEMKYFSKEERVKQLQDELNASLVRYQQLIEEKVAAEKNAADANRGYSQQQLDDADKLLSQYKTHANLKKEYELERQRIIDAGKLKAVDVTAELTLLKDQYDKATGAAKTLKQVNSDALKELQDQIQAEQDLIDETAIAYAALRDAQAEARNEVILGSLDRNEKLREEIESSREVVLSLQLGTRAYSELEFARLRDAIATNEQIIANAKLNGATEDAIKYAETYNETLKDQLELKEELANVKRIEKSFKADAKRIEDLEETRVKATKDANVEIERANDRLYGNLARSITDSIVRGFENGLSFVDNFKQAITNAFKSFFVNVGVNFVQGAMEQVFGSVTKGIFGSIATAFSGSAMAGGDGVATAGLLDQAKNVFNVVTKGFDAANIAFEQGIQQFGTWVTDFGSIGESLGGMISQYSGAIANALPYTGAVLSLLQGDIKGAAFQGGGVAIGSLLGGPIGGAIGGAIGSFVGGLFGGKDIPLTGDQARGTYSKGISSVTSNVFGEGSVGAAGGLEQLTKVFADRYGALLRLFDTNAEFSTNAIFRNRTNQKAYFGLGGGISDADKLYSNKNAGFEDFVKGVLGKGLAKAIKKASIIPTFIKELFLGITDQQEIVNMIGAVTALTRSSVQLSSRFGLTVENAAKLSKETGLVGDELVAFINKLAGVATSLKTPAQQILEYKQVLTDALGGSLPATIDAFDNVLKSFDTTTLAGRALFIEMYNLRDAFLQFTNAIDGVKKGVSDTIFGLLSPQEQALRNRARLEEEFAKFNLAVPKTVQQLIAIGEGIDYTTEAGLTLAMAFPLLAQAFQAVNAEVIRMNGLLNPNAFRTFTDFVIAKSYATYGQPIPAANMPSYAVGTPYVPNDGVAMLHQGEAVLTRSENASMSVNSGRMVSLLGTLIEKVSGLEYDMKRTADGTQRTVSELEDITGGYVTINTQAA